MDYQGETALLLQAVRDAGTLLKKYFGQEMEKREKAPQDLVTEADLASEKLIRARILEHFPEDAITGEEGGASGDSSRRWTIDPLDGTVNFAHGVPIFAVCVGFADEKGPASGAVYNPLTHECVTAVRGRGAFLNGLPIRASSTQEVGSSHIYINAHGLRERHAEALLEIYRRMGRSVQGVLNPGSMSTGLCWVACGRLDAAMGLDVDRYSTPASHVILQEAGVKITTLRGDPYTPASPSLLCANPVLHAALLARLQDLG